MRFRNKRKKKLKRIIRKYFILSRLSSVTQFENSPISYRSAAHLIEISSPHSKQVKGITEKYYVGYRNEDTEKYFNTGYKMVSGKYLFSIIKNRTQSKYHESYQYVIILEKINMEKRLSFQLQVIRDDIELLQSIILEESNKINLLSRLLLDDKKSSKEFDSVMKGIQKSNSYSNGIPLTPRTNDNIKRAA